MGLKATVMVWELEQLGGRRSTLSPGMSLPALAFAPERWDPCWCRGLG